MNEVVEVYNNEFPNGWGIDIQRCESGFGHMYPTNYKYSVCVFYNRESFMTFYNIETAKECFDMIVETMKF